MREKVTFLKERERKICNIVLFGKMEIGITDKLFYFVWIENKRK